MKLSKEKEQLVLKNQKLVFYLVNRLGIAPNSVEYEDMTSIGTIGLVKAAYTFDESKKNTFATYASKCIHNEIFMYYRKAKKYANDISIDDTIGYDGEGNELTLRDTIEHPESDFVEKISDEECFIQVMSIILNFLDSRSRSIVLFRLGNMTQENIGRILNVSRSYVNRLESKAICKIQRVLEKTESYQEIYSIAIIDTEYILSFNSKDVRNFNKILAKCFLKFTSDKNWVDFKVICKNERVKIKVPAIPESFCFLAKIIQEIGCSLHCSKLL